MLNLSNTQRNWVVLAIAAWIVALIGLIFIPQSRPEAAEVKIAPTNSLTTSLAGARPNSGAVVANLVNPALVYDTNTYSAYTILCPNEPPELINAKLEAFELDPALDLNGRYGYVLLLPHDVEAPVSLDQVALNDINICTTPHTETYPLDAGMPFFYSDGQWQLGIAQ
ncbi:hypothetical protein [Corynebacterium riegelii]|uniref:Uncharacterized protein n=1 Tax=Corynebacterium riegelii TaxID=156976 RepID=A0A0K1RCZ2_9CORY|nr:hypothetical protein [Corynebacterium riegelii]AKV59066.1 hypothetical protein AK829_07755 [Corynebacterium riegelii]